jgi:hypothetical protein
MDREQLGVRLQEAIDGIAAAAGRRAWGAPVLGAGLGLVVIGGGLAAFLLVWAVLVGLLN